MARRLDRLTSMTPFDSLIEGAVLIGAGSGKVVLANRAAAIIFGYTSPEAMVGVDPLDHIPSEDRGRVAGIMAGYFVEGDLQRRLDVKAITVDGREVWVIAVGVKIEYEGEIAGLILVQDITAQKTAERALAEAEERQRQILDNANESILVLQNGNVVYANPKALELGGFSEEEIKGKPFSDFLLAEDREKIVRRYLRKAGSRDYSSSFAVRGLGKNGSVRWSEIRESSFMWEGKPAEICLVNDITERKKAEEALAASEKRYHLLTDNVSDVIWVTDLQLKPTYFNPSIAKLLGYSVEEAMAGALK
jgi:PAS domain S-box-containing protein